jgi:GNAT superfamily N-acetyltransferase
MEIRRARPGEAAVLSEIALSSKAYWGYDSRFIEACREALTLSERSISEDFIYVLEASSGIIGFFSLTADPGKSELDFLFIKPEHIGLGYGKLLWNRILETAREAGISEFTIDADPNAEAFYLKMGAVRIGEVDSTVFSNRKLPLLKVTLDQENRKI